MNHTVLTILNLSNAGCWGVCFWWMHRISKRQNSVLAELAGQARRIEDLSKKEHEILAEVHPSVEAIHEGVDKSPPKSRGWKSVLKTAALSPSLLCRLFLARDRTWESDDLRFRLLQREHRLRSEFSRDDLHQSDIGQPHSRRSRDERTVPQT